MIDSVIRTYVYSFMYSVRRPPVYCYQNAAYCTMQRLFVSSR